VVIEAGVPGLTKSDVSVEIESGTLTITGNKVIKSNVDEKICNSYRELKHSSFIRSFSLSENIDTNTVDAKVENGLLTIKLNKIKPTNVSQKKKINIS
jgi:HSP20 family protein